MPESRICVLASGGVESSALLYLASRRYRQVFPLYISHGFLWEKAERYWLQKFIRRLGTRSLQPLTVCRYPLGFLFRGHWSLSGTNVPNAASRDLAVFLPGRNVLLLSLAGVFCYVRKIPHLAIGTLASNPFPDSSASFFSGFETALRRGLHFPIQIARPFARLKKKDVLRLARQAPLELSFSCLNPKGKSHCGRCNKCAERERAF